MFHKNFNNEIGHFFFLVAGTIEMGSHRYTVLFQSHSIVFFYERGRCLYVYDSIGLLSKLLHLAEHF